MNWDKNKGNWRQPKGNAGAEVSSQIDGERDAINGSRKLLLGRLQARHVKARDVIEQEVSRFIRSL